MGFDLVINEFRELNGKNRVNVHNSFNCEQHCWAMIAVENLYHAEPCYLNGWREAIAKSNYWGNWSELERCMIFEVLGNSPEHKDILLNSSELVYGVINFGGNVYLTIRGK